MDYKEYLAKIVELTRQVSGSETQSSYPAKIDSPALRALYDNLEDKPGPVVEEAPPIPYGMKAVTALALDQAIRSVKKADWRGNRFKEQSEVRNAIRSKLGDDEGLINAMFEIVITWDRSQDLSPFVPEFLTCPYLSWLS